MKYIKNIIFAGVVLSSYCMEHVSLVKKDLRTEIQKYFQETIPSIRFSQLSERYEQLPLKLRGRIVLHMSDELRLLHRLSLYLPYDVQKKIFVLYMGDYKPMLQIEGGKPTEDEEKKIEKIKKDNQKIDLAIEKFCAKKSIIKAFGLYHNIRKNIRESDSIVPLFVMKKKERINFLCKLNPLVDTWIKNIIEYDPVMSIEEQQHIHMLEEDEQEYFKGKNILLLSGDEGMDVYNQSKGFLLTSIILCCVGGLVFPICCCIGGPQLACAPKVAGPALGAVGGGGCIFCVMGLLCERHLRKDIAQKITL